MRQGDCDAVSEHDRELPELDLFTPLELRGLRLPNRIAMSPMCQYVAQDGFASDWHLVHLGSRASGGTGFIVVEATAVTPEGRITPGDLGLWSDEQIAPLARIVDFVHSQGTKIAIQLAHAGRKGSCAVPWKGGQRLSEAEGGWPVVGPSALPFREGEPDPLPLDAAGIVGVRQAFADSTRRALAAGFDAIEIHSAHGYLLHSFLSPLSNRRADEYGGSRTNRMRALLETTEDVRSILPEAMPLLVRISATDWVDGGWELADSIALARELKTRGVDLIDVSSGGSAPVASIPVAKGYQVPFAKAIKHDAGIRTGAVGLITEPSEANDVICRGDADLVLLGRQLLREPYWAVRAMTESEVDPPWPISYGYAVRRRPRG